MHFVAEADAAAIRAAYVTGGERSVAIELRRRFPGIPDNAAARAGGAKVMVRPRQG